MGLFAAVDGGVGCPGQRAVGPQPAGQVRVAALAGSRLPAQGFPFRQHPGVFAIGADTPDHEAGAGDTLGVQGGPAQAVADRLAAHQVEGPVQG